VRASIRVQLTGEHGRVHQVTKQHGELAAFGLWRMRLGQLRGDLGHLVGLCARCPKPDEDFALFIHRQLLGIDQVFLEIFHRLVIELQPPFQHAIREPLFSLEQRDDLIEKSVIVHHRPSTWASAASAWGIQKVISIVR
jgi:hypothetical protein